MRPELSILSPLPIAGYARTGFNAFNPRMSTHEQDVMDDHVNVLRNLVHKDHGLETHQKKHLTTMLNSPEYVEHFLAGATGTLLMRSVKQYAQLPKPAQTLLSLAGFGIGNIIYNELHEDKFSEYDPATSKSRIKF